MGLRAVVPVLIAGLALGGCGAGSNAPLEIGGLPEDVGGPIDLTVSPDSSGVGGSRSRACDLVTDDVLRSLLPQIETINRTSGGTTDAACHYALDVPLDMFEYGSPSLRVAVWIPGESESVDGGLLPDFGRLETVEGGECAMDKIRIGTTLLDVVCSSPTGAVAFRASYLAFSQAEDADPYRYRISEPSSGSGGASATTEVSFSNEYDRLEFLRDRILEPIVVAILRRLNGQ